MAGQQNFTAILIGLLLIGLFSFSLIQFGGQFADENDANQSILDDPRISAAFGNLNTTLKTIETNASKQREGFESEDPKEGFGSLLFFSIVGAGKTFASLFVGIFNLLLTYIFQTLFGSTFSLILSAIIGVFLIIIVFYLWRVYKAGE